jgi:hypothetical protein
LPDCAPSCSARAALRAISGLPPGDRKKSRVRSRFQKSMPKQHAIFALRVSVSRQSDSRFSVSSKLVVRSWKGSA